MGVKIKEAPGIVAGYDLSKPPASKVLAGMVPHNGPKSSAYAKHLGEPAGVPHKAAVGTVSVEKKKDGQVVHQGMTNETVHAGVDSGPETVEISVSGGRTLQTQPFEFVRIDVGLKMNFPKSDMDAGYEFITDWVGSKLQEAEKAFKG